jgi:hypothetical protein
MGYSEYKLYMQGRAGTFAPTDKKKEGRGRRAARLIRAAHTQQQRHAPQHGGKPRACFYAALLSVFFCACMLLQYSLLVPAIAATGIEQARRAPELFAVPAPPRDTASCCTQ